MLALVVACGGGSDDGGGDEAAEEALEQVQGLEQPDQQGQGQALPGPLDQDPLPPELEPADEVPPSKPVDQPSNNNSGSDDDDDSGDDDDDPPPPPPPATLTLDAVNALAIAEAATLNEQLVANLSHSSESLSYSCSADPSGPCPAGLSISGTGLLSWTPGFDDAGSYPIIVTATAGDLNASQSTTVTVSNTNRAPTISVDPLPTPYETQLVGAGLTVNFSGSDADGPATITLLGSTALVNCDAASEGSWTVIDNTLSTADSQGSWTLTDPGLNFLCVKIDDGEATTFAAASGAYLVLPNDMQLWLRADAGVTESGGAVSNWADQSGNGHDASQSDTNAQPMLVDDAINGLPVMRFDGEGDHFTDARSYDGRTVFSVQRISSVTQQTSDLAQVWGSYPDSIHVAIEARNGDFSFSFDGGGSTTASYRLDNGTFSAALANGVESPWVYDTTHIMETRFEAAITISEQTIGQLGASIHTAHHLGGDIGEIIVFDRLLDAAETAAVRFYLEQRWDDSISTDPAPDPSNLNVTGTSDVLVSLSWDSGGGSTTGFRIAYAEGNTAPATCYHGTIVGEGDIGNATSYSVAGLTADTTYSLRLCAVNTGTVPTNLSAGITVTATTLEDQPNPPLAGISFWVSGDVGVVDDGSGNASSWQDRSGSSHNADQSDANYRPTIVTGGLAGNDTIRFDGEDDFLTGTHTYTGRTVFAVYKMDSALQDTSDLAQIWGQYTGVGQVGPDPRGGSRGFSFDGSTSSEAIYAFDGGAYTATAAANTNTLQWTYDTWHIVAVEFTADLNLTEHTLGFLGGSFSVGEHHLGGEIAEIIVYDTTLDAATRSEVESYLQTKWGL